LLCSYRETIVNILLAINILVLLSGITFECIVLKLGPNTFKYNLYIIYLQHTINKFKKYHHIRQTNICQVTDNCIGQHFTITFKLFPVMSMFNWVSRIYMIQLIS